MLRNDLVLRAARRERTERTPVWMMRQAGRTDPAYRSLREQANLPQEAMFQDVDMATQASLLPVRFGVDAVIIYQDILTLLTPMGTPFVFRPGPHTDSPIATSTDIDRLCGLDPSTDMSFVGDTIQRVRKELDGEMPVLGFAGAPLTLAFFMLAGKSPGTTAGLPQKAMEVAPQAVHRLLDKLTDATIAYLAYQIEQGVDAFQLFESVADLLTPAQYKTFAHPYHQKIFAELKGRVPGILFAKEEPNIDLMVDSGAEVLSIGRCLDLAECKMRFGHKVAFQGNVDNMIVAHGTLEQIDHAVHDCVRAGDQHGHILNLSHGLLKETPFENVQQVIKSARHASHEPELQSI